MTHLPSLPSETFLKDFLFFFEKSPDPISGNIRRPTYCLMNNLEHNTSTNIFFQDSKIGGTMKRFYQISIIVVLALALVLTVFAFTGASSQMASGKICPNAGWNTRSASCSFGTVPSLEGFAYYRLPPEIMPNAGWNT